MQIIGILFTNLNREILCAKFQGDRSTRLRFIAIFSSVRKERRKKPRNFGFSYLGNGLSDFLQIWNVDSPSWRETVQKSCLQLDKGSLRYKGVKITFSFFLSIYPPRCGAPTSWAARHTMVCLDTTIILQTSRDIKMNL